MHYPKHQIPLVIGVTGHRDIDPENPALRCAVDNVLQSLRQDSPNTPFVVLSPLAEGADRLVVTLARERLAAGLIVPLPLPLDLYHQDFQTAESHAEFDRLLQTADERIPLPVPEADAEAVADRGEARDRQYARAGAYVAEHCQILLAIWDGQTARGIGGTADVVGWALDRRVPEQFSTLPPDDLLDPVTLNLVVSIHPRTAVSEVLGGVDRERESRAAFARLDGFNRDASRFVRESGAEIATALQRLWKSDIPPPPLQTDEMEWLLSVYGAADGMAIYYQRQNRWAWHAMYGLFAFSVICFGLLDWMRWLVLSYVLGTGALFVFYRWLKHESVRDRFLDYRALAEGLRVLLFWQINSVPHRVSVNYLRKHGGILSWIRHSLSNIETIALLKPFSHDLPAPEVLAFTKATWVRNQQDYFETQLKTLPVQTAQLNRIISGGYSVMLAAAALYGLVIIGEWFGLFSVGERWPVLDAFFQSLIGLSGATSLAAGTYKSREAIEETQKQYAMLAPLYRRASEQLDLGVRPARDILFRLGREALQENGEWLWWRRSQAEEPPKG